MAKIAEFTTRYPGNAKQTRADVEAENKAEWVSAKARTFRNILGR